MDPHEGDRLLARGRVPHVEGRPDLVEHPAHGLRDARLEGELLEGPLDVLDKVPDVAGVAADLEGGAVLGLGDDLGGGVEALELSLGDVRHLGELAPENIAVEDVNFNKINLKKINV